jgi:uncharacterized protein YukE
MLRRVSALPDPFELRAIADRIAGHAAAARERAERLERATAAVGWDGFAAEAFDGQAHLATGALRSAAARLDDAADTLRREADRIGRLIADAVRLGGDVVELLTDGLFHPDEVLGDVGHLVRDGADLAGQLVGSYL